MKIEAKYLANDLFIGLREATETVNRLKEELIACSDEKKRLEIKYEETETDYLKRIKDINGKIEDIVLNKKEVDDELMQLKQNKPEPIIHREEKVKPFLIFFKRKCVIETKDYSEVKLWEEKINALEVEKTEISDELKKYELRCQEIRTEYEEYANAYTNALKEYEKAIKQIEKETIDSFNGFKA